MSEYRGDLLGRSRFPSLGDQELKMDLYSKGKRVHQPFVTCFCSQVWVPVKSVSFQSLQLMAGMTKSLEMQH